MTPNFQRNNSTSNAAEGKKFELLILEYFNRFHGLDLIKNVKVAIGTSTTTPKKLKAFDLGIQGKIVVECKSHTWREGGNTPQAKLTTWNEAMYLFLLTPDSYRKLFVVERFFGTKYNCTLGAHYIKTYGNLIPDTVEIWEYDRETVSALRLK